MTFKRMKTWSGCSRRKHRIDAVAQLDVDIALSSSKAVAQRQLRPKSGHQPCLHFQRLVQ